MNLAKAHRINACFLGLFLIIHLANHSLLLGGLGAHLSGMDIARKLYRPRAIEAALIAAFALQILMGLALVWRRGRPQGGWAWAQVVSGLYLAFFLVQHVPAVLTARMGDLDTNVFFAASVVQRMPLALYFAPYYVLALIALATHIAAFLRFRVWP